MSHSRNWEILYFFKTIIMGLRLGAWVALVLIIWTRNQRLTRRAGRRRRFAAIRAARNMRAKDINLQRAKKITLPSADRAVGVDNNRWIYKATQH